MRWSFCWKSIATKALAPAVHIDAAGGHERVDHGLQRRDVQVRRRLLDRADIGEGDLLDDRREVVTRADVAADHAHAVVGTAGLGGQGKAELRVAGQAEGPAEPDDRGLRGGALPRLDLPGSMVISSRRGRKRTTGAPG
jgi:hypothetical protein